MTMPKICEHCGKEHATLEELKMREAKSRGMALKDVSTFGEFPNSQEIETVGKPVKVRIKKKE